MRLTYVRLSVAVVALLSLGLLAVIFPDYFRLLRPNVLKQLDPQVVKLVNELPGVDKQNKKIIGRLFAHGGLAHAKEGPDGVMRSTSGRRPASRGSRRERLECRGETPLWFSHCLRRERTPMSISSCDATAGSRPCHGGSRSVLVQSWSTT